MNYGAQRKDTREAKDAVDDFEKESGEELSDKAEELLAKGDEKVPTFPFFILSIALLKDVIDMLDFTIVGIILVELAMLPLSVILFLWLFNKIHGGRWKKQIIKWLWNRYILVMIIEFIPGFQLVPATTIFVLMAHYKESKAVKIFNRMLEKLRAVAEGDRSDSTVLRAGYDAYMEENQVDGVVPPQAGNDNKKGNSGAGRDQNSRPTQNSSMRDAPRTAQRPKEARGAGHDARKTDTRTPPKNHQTKTPPTSQATDTADASTVIPFTRPQNAPESFEDNLEDEIDSTEQEDMVDGEALTDSEEAQTPDDQDYFENTTVAP